MPKGVQFPINLTTTANGDIIGCGYANTWYTAWVFRASQDGTILWQRYLSDSLQRPWSPLYLTNLVETSDGLIAFTGFVFDSIPGLNPYSEDNSNTVPLLMVMDADGCLLPGCTEDIHYITSIKESSDSFIVKLETYPNPASEWLTVNVPSFICQAGCSLELRDLTGRLQSIERLDALSTSETLNIRDLPNGFYLLSLHSSGKMMNRRKEIIQH